MAKANHVPSTNFHYSTCDKPFLKVFGIAKLFHYNPHTHTCDFIMQMRMHIHQYLCKLIWCKYENYLWHNMDDWMGRNGARLKETDDEWVKVMSICACDRHHCRCRRFSFRTFNIKSNDHKTSYSSQLCIYLSVASQVLSIQYKSSLHTLFLMFVKHVTSVPLVVGVSHSTLNASIHRFYVFPFDSITSLDILCMQHVSKWMAADKKKRTHISHTWHIQLNAF